MFLETRFQHVINRVRASAVIPLRLELWNGHRFDLSPEPTVTIVIPTRDRLHLLQDCVELLEETVDWRHAKLVNVDDHSRDADAVQYLARIQQRTDLQCRVVRPALVTVSKTPE